MLTTIKKSKYIITNLLAFLVFICSSSCSSEAELIENSNSRKENIIRLHKNYDFVKSNTSLFSKLNNADIQKSTAKTKNIETADFTIFTERVTYTQNVELSTESYAFYIEKKGQISNRTIDNLILTKNLKDENYKAYIITYFFPDGIASEHKNFIVSNFKELNNQTFSFKNSTAKTACTFDYEFIEIAHRCYSGNHSGASEVGQCDGKGSLPYSTYSVKVLTLNCGSESGGISSPEGGFYPNTGENNGGGGKGGGKGGGHPVDTGISLPPPCQTSECDVKLLANDINEMLGNTLNYEQLKFLFDNNDVALLIKNFLESKNNSESRSLATEYISNKNLKVCLSSFKFTDIGANWQNAGVSDVNIQFLTIGNIIALNNVHFSQLHFGLPKSKVGGDFITNNNARYIAQIVITQAEVLTNTYQSINPTSTANQLKTFFYGKLQEGMAEYGGTISTSPPLGWNGQLKQHQTFILSSGLECD